MLNYPKSNLHDTPNHKFLSAFSKPPAMAQPNSSSCLRARSYAVGKWCGCILRGLKLWGNKPCTPPNNTKRVNDWDTFRLTKDIKQDQTGTADNGLSTRFRHNEPCIATGETKTLCFSLQVSKVAFLCCGRVKTDRHDSPGTPNIFLLQIC